jgi:hypothetical protein
MQKSAPVQAGVTIFSGQVISLYWNNGLTRFEWVLGGNGNAVATDPVYFANADSEDPDVISADSLPALSCYGQFVLQTGYYTGSGWVHGTPVTYDGVTGSIKTTTVGSGAPVVGTVEGINGPISLVKQDSSATNLNVVQIATRFEPANA